MTSRQGRSHRAAGASAALGAVLYFSWNLARFFPNAGGGLGADYGYYTPWMLAGYFWQRINGFFTPAEFTPSFCGGIPMLFSPQSSNYALTQWILGVLPPVQSFFVSWLLFGLCGAAGMYALLRRVYGVSPSAALLGATIFLLNGFYTARMIIGHVTFHGVMLLALIMLTVFAPTPTAAAGRRWAIALRAIILAFLLAYMVYGGGFYIIISTALAPLLLALVLYWLQPWPRDAVRIAAVGCLLAAALCAYKILPAMAFAGHVVRPVALLMTPNIVGLLGGAVIALFVPQVISQLEPGLTVLNQEELAYGVGIVPLLALLAGLVAAARRGHLTGPRGFLGGNRRVLLVGLVLLAVPILVNYDGFGLRWLMLHTPIVNRMSVMVRFWWAYIPLLCVLTALLLDFLVADAPARGWWAAGAMLLTIGQWAVTDTRYYSAQTYNPAPIEAAYAAVHAGAPVPAITRIADPWAEDASPAARSRARNDAVVAGVSDVPCYEPMFGYRLKSFVSGALHPGPVLDRRGGRLNLKNPACYIFPAANNCAPGEEFTVAQIDDATAFTAYRPFAYVWPLWQWIAAAISAVAAAVCLLVLVVAGPYLGWIALRSRATRAGTGRGA